MREQGYRFVTRSHKVTAFPDASLEATRLFMDGCWSPRQHWCWAGHRAHDKQDILLCLVLFSDGRPCILLLGNPNVKEDGLGLGTLLYELRGCLYLLG